MTDINEDKIYEDFGIRLKSLRKAKGKTQKELSLDMNLSQTAIAQYESGTRRLPLSVLKKFSAYFGLTLDELIDPTDNKKDIIENSIENNFSHTIKELRKERNLTKVELANEIGLTTDEIVKYESGSREIPLSILIKFSSFFDVSTDQLIGISYKESNTAFVTTNENITKHYKTWNEKIGYNTHFDTEEVQQIIDFAKYLISKRENNHN